MANPWDNDPDAEEEITTANPVVAPTEAPVVNSGANPWDADPDADTEVDVTATPTQEEVLSGEDPLMEGLNADRQESIDNPSIPVDKPETTVRSYDDLYASTIAKYPKDIQDMYAVRSSQLMTPITQTPEQKALLDKLDNELDTVYNKAGESGDWSLFDIPARFQYKTQNNPDFDPTQPEDPVTNPSMTHKKYFISPPDQNAIMRIGYQVMNNIVAGIGDMATGNFTKEGPVGKALPDQVPNGMIEDFTTEAASLVIGPGVIAKGLTKTTDGVKLAAKASGASNLARKTVDMMSPEMTSAIKNTYATVLSKTGSAQQAMSAATKVSKKAIVGLGYGLVDAGIVNDDSTGMIVSPGMVKSVFGEMDDRRANDISVMLETPVISYTVGMFGRMYNTVAEKGVKPALGGLRQISLFNNASGKAMNVAGKVPGLGGVGISEMDAGLKTITWIDPNLQNIPVEDFVFKTKVFGDALERNAKKNMQLANAGKDVGLDSASAFVPAAKDYFRMAYADQKEIMGAKPFADWVDQQAQESANRFFELRTALSGEAEVSGKMAKGSDDMKSLFEEGADSTGKVPKPITQTQEQAAARLVTDETSKLQGPTQTLASAETRAATDAEAFKNGLKNDPTLRELMVEADLTDNLGSNAQVNDRLVKALPEPMYRSFRTMKEASTNAYKRLGDSTAEIDEVSFLNAMKRIPGATNEAGELINPQLKRMAEEVSENPTFGHAYNKISNDINDMIKKTKDEDLISGLYALKKNIKVDQVNELTKNVDPAVKELADEANQAYINYRTTWGDSQELRQLSETGKARLQGENFSSGMGPGQGVTDWNTNAIRTVEQNIGTTAGGNVLDSINRAVEAGGESIRKPLTDYYSTKAVKNLADSATIGGTGVADFRRGLKDVITNLDKLNAPIVPKLKQIETNLQTLEGAKNISAEELGKVQEQVSQIYAESQKSVAAQFAYKFDPKAKTNVPVSNPEKVMDNIFNSNDSGNQIQELMNRATAMGDEGAVIKDAIQGSYIDYVKRKVFSRNNLGMAAVTDAGKTVSGFAVNAKNAEVFFESPQNMRNMEIAFAGTDIPKQLDEIVNLTKNLTQKTPRQAGEVLGRVPPELNPASATNTAITLMFGVLNPTATRIRKFTSNATIDNLDQVIEARKAAMVAFVVDPMEASRIIKAAADDSLFRKNRQDAIRLLVRGGAVALDQQEDKFDKTQAIERRRARANSPKVDPNLIGKDLSSKKTVFTPDQVRDVSDTEGGDFYRPFTPDEGVDNKDGSFSTERSLTAQDPETGEWMNIPSLWMDENDKPVDFKQNEDGAVNSAKAYEAMGGESFKRFKSLEEAEKAAKTRSKNGGAGSVKDEMKRLK